MRIILFFLILLNYFCCFSQEGITVIHFDTITADGYSEDSYLSAVENAKNRAIEIAFNKAGLIYTVKSQYLEMISDTTEFIKLFTSVSHKGEYKNLKIIKAISCSSDIYVHHCKATISIDIIRYNTENDREFYVSKIKKLKDFYKDKEHFNFIFNLNKDAYVKIFYGAGDKIELIYPFDDSTESEHYAKIDYKLFPDNFSEDLQLEYDQNNKFDFIIIVILKQNLKYKNEKFEIHNLQTFYDWYIDIPLDIKDILTETFEIVKVSKNKSYKQTKGN